MAEIKAKRMWWEGADLCFLLEDGQELKLHSAVVESIDVEVGDGFTTKAKAMSFFPRTITFETSFATGLHFPWDRFLAPGYYQFDHHVWAFRRQGEEEAACRDSTESNT